MDELVTQLEIKKDSEEKFLRLGELIEVKREEYLTKVGESHEVLNRMIDSAMFLNENVIFLFLWKYFY